MVQSNILVISHPTLEESQAAVFGIDNNWALGDRVSAIIECAELNLRDCLFAWPDPAWKVGNFLAENVIPRFRGGLQTELESRALQPYLKEEDSKYVEGLLLHSGLAPGSDVDFLRQPPTLAELYGITFAALRQLLLGSLSEFASKTDNPLPPVIGETIERNRVADELEERARSYRRSTG